MKKLILATLALLLVCAVVPAMAGEKSNSLELATFQALSNLSAPGQVALNAMTDEQLAEVEGQAFRHRRRGGDKNVSTVYIVQSNSIGCAFAKFCKQNFNYQSNTAYVEVNQKN